MISTKKPRNLPPNIRGKDWFVGDIHGNFQGLSRALEQCGFSPGRDRLIAMGDLVDRGKDSHEALKWLQKPFFHAIRGNHEDMFLTWHRLRHDPAKQRAYEEEIYFRKGIGGEWTKDVEPSVLDAISEGFSRLPYTMQVHTRCGKTIGAVHGEIPDGMQWAEIHGNENLDRSTCAKLVWGRSRWRSPLKSRDENIIDGVDALVSGHMLTRDPHRIGNIVYIDTGGWTRSGRFSLLSAEQILEIANRRLGIRSLHVLRKEYRERIS